MAHQIDTKTEHDQTGATSKSLLKKLRRNVHLGFRKLSSGGGTWTARVRDDSEHDHWKKLGELTPAYAFNEASPGR